MHVLGQAASAGHPQEDLNDLALTASPRFHISLQSLFGICMPCFIEQQLILAPGFCMFCIVLPHSNILSSIGIFAIQAFKLLCDFLVRVISWKVSFLVTIHNPHLTVFQIGRSVLQIPLPAQGQGGIKVHPFF